MEWLAQDLIMNGESSTSWKPYREKSNRSWIKRNLNNILVVA